jgi:prepilin-type N-terminal cleavage/methylation domain-containing protein
MNARGFTLVEVLTALVLLSAALLSTAQLLVTTGAVVHAARLSTSTATLAAARMEELRSLTWGFDSAGNPVTDTSTNLALERPGSSGAGLTPSPSGALDQNISGYADFLDAAGRWVSAGPSIPPRAVFVRRWAIEPPADGSPDSLVLRVLVRAVVDDGRDGRSVTGGVRESRLTTLRTRVAR